eukprot:15347925-Alexandrium_andersonii.AAC.1
MSASLVGSEMCIRDRSRTGATQRRARAVSPPSPARGRSVGINPSDSRAPWTSTGGSPGAGPR